MWIETQPTGNYRPRDIPFQAEEGLTTPLAQTAQPYDYFKLYFTNAVINKIVEETNRYAAQYKEAQRDTLRPQFMVHDWSDTNAEEIKNFLEFAFLWDLFISQEFGCTGQETDFTALQFLAK